MVLTGKASHLPVRLISSVEISKHKLCKSLVIIHSVWCVYMGEEEEEEGGAKGWTTHIWEACKKVNFKLLFGSLYTGLEWFYLHATGPRSLTVWCGFQHPTALYTVAELMCVEFVPFFFWWIEWRKPNIFKLMTYFFKVQLRFSAVVPQVIGWSETETPHIPSAGSSHPSSRHQGDDMWKRRRVCIREEGGAGAVCHEIHFKSENSVSGMWESCIQGLWLWPHTQTHKDIRLLYTHETQLTTTSTYASALRGHETRDVSGRSEPPHSLSFVFWQCGVLQWALTPHRFLTAHQAFGTPRLVYSSMWNPDIVVGEQFQKICLNRNGSSTCYRMLIKWK